MGPAPLCQDQVHTPEYSIQITQVWPPLAGPISAPVAATPLSGSVLHF